VCLACCQRLLGRAPGTRLPDNATRRAHMSERRGTPGRQSSLCRDIRTTVATLEVRPSPGAQRHVWRGGVARQSTCAVILGFCRRSVERAAPESRVAADEHAEYTRVVSPSRQQSARADTSSSRCGRHRPIQLKTTSGSGWEVKRHWPQR